MVHSIQNLIDAPIVVLLYHRVADLTTDPQLLAVSVANFEAHIKHVKENYPVLRFDESWEQVSKPSIVISFDDGYCDNYYNALPILQKYDVPATIFVSSGNIDTNREFWWDDLERIILLNHRLPKELTLEMSTGRYCFPLGNGDAVWNCYNQLHPILKQLSAQEREKVLNDLDKRLQPNVRPRDLYRTMSSMEINDMVKSGLICIGGHTITHTPLSIQNLDEQKTEIEVSKKILENFLTNTELVAFSYPFGGKTDYNLNSIKLARQSGYQKIASNFPGQVHKGSNLYEIPRHLVRNWTIEEFQAQLQRFWYI